MSKCLFLSADNSIAGDQHLPNIFLTSVVNWLNAQLIVDFDIFVVSGHGGGGVYLSNGGFLSSLRGPELVWNPNGQWEAVDSSGNLVAITNSFPQGSWQSVRLLVHLDSATFDVLLAPKGSPLVSLASNLPFRGGFQNSLDRLTVARFDALPDAQAYFDNFSVEIPGAPFFVQYPRCVLVSDPSVCTNLVGIATGTPPLAYQWRVAYELAPMPNETNTTLASCVEMPGFPGFYLTVSNSLGVIYSDKVQVLANPTFSLNQPQLQAGQFAFSVSTFAGLEYVTEFKAHLDDLGWTAIQTNIGSGGGPFGSENGTLLLTNLLSGGTGFYRLLVR
jgi:hypothetical protein